MKKNIAFLLFLSVVCGWHCHSPKKNLTAATAVTIIPRSSWNAAAPMPYKQHTPVRLTLHHEAGRFELGGDAPRHIYNIQRWGMGPDRKWTDIPYHFLIAPDGTIYEGRDVFTVGETATEYDPTGHLLICCLGNYDKTEVYKEVLASIIQLMAYCSRKYNISYQTIASHRDYSSQTNCPGKYLYPYIQNGYIKEEVRKLLGE